MFLWLDIRAQVTYKIQTNREHRCFLQIAVTTLTSVASQQESSYPSSAASRQQTPLRQTAAAIFHYQTKGTNSCKRTTTLGDGRAVRVWSGAKANGGTASEIVIRSLMDNVDRAICRKWEEVRVDLVQPVRFLVMKLIYLGSNSRFDMCIVFMANYSFSERRRIQR
jgi:hypothetical protein